QGPPQARLGLCRPDHRLFLYAGDGPGQRPPAGLRGRAGGGAAAPGVRPPAVMLYQLVVVLWAASEVVIGITRAAPLGIRGQDRFSGQALVGGLVLSLWAGYFLGRAVPS